MRVAPLRNWSIFLNSSALAGCSRLSNVKAYGVAGGGKVKQKVVKAVKSSHKEGSGSRNGRLNNPENIGLRPIGNDCSQSGSGTENRKGYLTGNGLTHSSTAQLVPPTSVDSDANFDTRRLGAPCRQHGCIHLIVGPMFAGKTTALLSRMQQETDRGRNVILVKSSLDTRYAANAVVSHDGVRVPCLSLQSMLQIKELLGDERYAQVDVIGVDEAQFISDIATFAVKAADYEGKTVVIAGLDGDFRREKFGGLVDLIPVAERVDKLHARCGVCGADAAFTLRTVQEDAVCIIGGTDTYMPVCRKHYLVGRTAVQVADDALKGSEHKPTDKVWPSDPARRK